MDGERKPLSLIGILAGGLLLSRVFTGVAPLPPQTQACPCSGAGGAEAPILAIRVKSLGVTNATMAEALLALRSQDPDHIVIGFERLPHPEGEKEGPISLVFANATVADILQHFCRADPRYEYKATEGLMVDVRPKGATEDPTDLLNVRVRDYNIDANVTAMQAIARIDQDAPELRDFLRRKHEEWMEKTDRQPGGSPGSIVSGNMPPPRFALHLQDVTVRQILDAISLKDTEAFIQVLKEGKRFDAQGKWTRDTPTGWEYDFVIKADAPTGLGGYPKWQAF